MLSIEKAGNDGEALLKGYACNDALIIAKARDGSVHVLPVQKGLVCEAFPGLKYQDALDFIALPCMDKAEMPQGEHKSPPKGDPKKRSEYADPDDFMFPIDDHEHTRAAISYFNKHKWTSGEHKTSAARRILRAAKKFGIKVDKDSDVSRAAGK